MMDKFAAMHIATSDLQRVRSSSASALAAFKLITDSNLTGGVNGVGNAGKRADQRQPEAISTLMAKG
jgi:hypothetical protein